ncbi:pantothenate transporter liz1 [Pseudohyphozyma bogoriensis]|nr:pantothenate transporter liz1 [Pseudohyphozyma bogoriensis]
MGGLSDVAPPPGTKRSSFLDYIWDSDRHLKSPAERRLVLKLDIMILSTIMFGYWMKYIDQSNFANAYVSGMQEDVGIVANQYTFANSLYNAALCICTIPGAMIATKVRPSIWLAMCEIGWMAFTFAQAGTKTVPQLYAFRFMVGAFEASFAPVAVHLMGSWYTKPELGKRVCLWYTAGTLGSATSGFLQAAIYKTLNGHLGMAGWRWLYIVCGLMTFPTAVLVLFVMPDYPSNNRSWFLTDEEREMAKKRCAIANMAPVTGKMNLALVKRIFGSWRFWCLIPTYIIFANSVQCYLYFAIWLKAAGFSTVDRNLLSSAMYLISIPFTFGYGFLADATRSRWKWMCIAETVALLPIGIVAFSPFDFHNHQLVRLKEFAFLFTTTVFMTPVFFTWINEICHENAEERAFMCGAANALFYMVNTWLPILLFPQVTAPTYPKGFKTTFAFAVASIPMILGVRWMQNRQEAIIKARGGHYHEEEASIEATSEKGEKVEPTGVAVPAL